MVHIYYLSYGTLVIVADPGSGRARGLDRAGQVLPVQEVSHRVRAPGGGVHGQGHEERGREVRAARAHRGESHT